MLSGDAARAALQKYAASESDRSKGIRVHKLLAPKLAADMVASLGDTRRPWRPVAEQLDALSLSKREKVLSALTPALGNDLDEVPHLRHVARQDDAIPLAIVRFGAGKAGSDQHRPIRIRRAPRPVCRRW